MDALFEPLASALGASVDQLKVITCLLLSYPLAAIYTRVHVPPLRHVFSISVSLFYLIAIFQLYNGTVQLLASILATYFICANVNGPRMPWIVFALVMGHLTINHIYRAFYEISGSTFEITGPQMVLTMKLTTFAWNVYDGRQPLEKLDQWQKGKRIVVMPSLLEFLGYSFYFPGMLVGPYLVFADYTALVCETVFVNSPAKSGAAVQQTMPAGRKRTAFSVMLRGLVCLGLYVVFGPKFNFSVLLEESWKAKNLATQLLLVQVIGVFERTKYYAIWSLTEGAAIVTGLGFSGYDQSGRSIWTGAANVDILAIEIPSGFKGLIDAWNIKTNVWLKECLYKRVTPTGNKPGFMSSMLTFLTSAFWHGIAGGYYLTFVLGGFIQAVQRTVRTTIRPLILPAAASLDKAMANHAAQNPNMLKRLYDAVGTLTTILIINFTVIPFILLDVHSSLMGWRLTHYYGHFMVGVPLLIFWLGGKKWLVGLQKERVKKHSSETGWVAGQPSTPPTPGPHVVPPIHQLSDRVTIS